jgi:hypothetical protein
LVDEGKEGLPSHRGIFETQLHKKSGIFTGLASEKWGWPLGMRMSLHHFEKENKDPKYHPAKDLATAWGVTVQRLNQKRKQNMENPLPSNK